MNAAKPSISADGRRMCSKCGTQIANANATGICPADKGCGKNPERAAAATAKARNAKLHAELTRRLADTINTTAPVSDPVMTSDDMAEAAAILGRVLDVIAADQIEVAPTEIARLAGVRWALSEMIST